MTRPSRVPPAVAAEALQGDPVALTQALVATPSVNPELEPGGEGEEEIARLTAAWLESWGFETRIEEVAPGRFNTIGRAGESGSTLLLNGHLDTVGVRGMSIPPHHAELRDGCLWGRGSCDMKAGVAAILSAARGWIRGGERKGCLIVALTADEEHASVGMQALVAEGIRADAAVVGEPTDLLVMPAHKGFLWTDLTVRGRAAHGSRPDIGVDAILEAAHVLVAIDQHGRALEGRPRHPLLGPPSLHAGTIAGGSAPSVYPSECRVQIERRTLPGETADGLAAELVGVVDQVRAARPDLVVEVEPGLFRPGTEVDGDHPVVSGLQAALAVEGRPTRTAGMSAWVDAAYLNEAGIPAVCFGPGSIARAHTDDERVPVEEIRSAARVLSRFTERFLG